MNMKPDFKFSRIICIGSFLTLVAISLYLFTLQTPDMKALANPDSSDDSTTPLAWALRFHQAGNEYIWGSMFSRDDGVIILVTEYSPDEGFGNHLLKVDKKGSLVWQQALQPGFTKLKPTADGGYIRRFYSLYSPGISKLDATGSEEWSRTYNLSPDSPYDAFIPQYFQQTSEGGYILAGFGATCAFFGCVSGITMVIKLDAQGNILWARRYHDMGDITSGQQTQDGGYILHGSVQIVKFDSQGMVIWAKQYGYNPDPLYLESVQPTYDGGYIVTGINQVGPDEYYCGAMKLQADGLVAWSKMYTSSYHLLGNTFHDVTNLEIVEDGFVLSCNLRPDPNNQDDQDFALLKLDGNGDIVWQKRYGGSRVDAVMNLIATEEGYFVAGISNSSSEGDFDIMLWRLDATGDICACDFVHEENSVVAVETTSQVTDLVVTAQDVVVTTGEFELLDEASDPFLPSFFCMSPQDKVTAIIPPTGGSFTSSDAQTEFIFPSGAFSETVSITYFHWYDPNVGGYGQMNRTFELTAVYSDTQQPATLAPNQTFTMTVHYAQTGAGTIIEETMGLYAREGEQWMMEESSTLDINAKTITAVPDHLGWFAALGETNRIHLPIILKGLRP